MVKYDGEGNIVVDLLDNSKVISKETIKQEINEIKDLSVSEVNEDKNKKKIENYINKFLSMKNPSRELIVNLIDRIDIYEDKRIDVKLSFASSCK